MTDKNCFGCGFKHTGQVEGEIYPEDDTTVWAQVENVDMCAGYKVSKCRSCGSTAALFSVRRANGYIEYAVRCLACGLTSIKETEQTNAVKRWNLLQRVIGKTKSKGDGGIEL